MPHPFYNTACTPALTVLPPFSFQGMTQRVFPLKADLYILRQFCDQYMNVAPGVTAFEPFLPFVYMLVVNYGKMTAAAANLGWIAQHEIAFSVPLLRYAVRHGRRELVDVVYMTPFIYVDDALSLTTGRQVYGWPKVLGHLDLGINSWLENPQNPQNVMSLSTEILPPRGGRASQRPLIEIVNLKMRSASAVPPRLGGLLGAVTALPRAVLGSLSLAQELAEIWAAPPLLGYDPGDRLPLVQALLRGLSGMPLARNPTVAIVTLKQFRDTIEPQNACYQALIQSPMQLGRLNAGGLLGELVTGDTSGGFRIKIHSYPSQPIVSGLGLEVEETITIDGNTVDVLRPVYPYWLDMDLGYGGGKAICWRTSDSEWHLADGRDVRPAVRPPAAAGNFDLALGPAAEEFTGPFEFSDTTAHVFPLQADPKVLAAFVRKYLPVPAEAGVLESCGSYVYLVVASVGRISSESEPLGFLSCRSATFHVPVVWQHAGARTVGLAVAYAFVSNSTVAISAQEEFGIPTIFAQVESPADQWLNSPAPKWTALEVRTQIFPALNMGVKAQERLLFAVTAGDVDAGPNMNNAERRAREQAQEIRRKEEAWRSVSPELAGRLLRDLRRNPLPSQLFTLKQLRDAADPQRACFQQVLYYDRLFESVEDLQLSADSLHVWIFNYPYIPIVSSLGLIGKTTSSGLPGVDPGGVAFDVFEPWRPFSFRATLKTSNASSLCWRAGSERWQTKPPHPPPFVGSNDPGKAPGRRQPPGRESADQAPPVEPQVLLEALLREGLEGGEPV